MGVYEQRRSKGYAIFVLTIAFLAALMIGFLTPSTAYGAQTPSAEYHYFDNAVAICEGGGKLYIADGNKIFSYSESASPKISSKPLFETRGTVSQMVYSANALFVLEDDDQDPDPNQHKIGTIGVYSLPDGTRTPLDFGTAQDEGYSAIALSNGALYAADNLRYIQRFSAVAYTYVGQATRASRNIEAMAAGSGNELFYAQTSASGYVQIYRYLTTGSGSELAAELNDGVPFSTMVYTANQLSVFTIERVFNFRTVNQPFTQNSVHDRPKNIRAVAAGSDGKFYSIGYDRSVSCFTNFASNPTMLLASRSTEWGFFDTPADVTTRGGRVYVADTFNQRLSVQDAGGFDGITGLPSLTSVASDTDGFIYYAYHDFGISKVAKVTVDEDGLQVLADFEFRPNGVSNLRIRQLRTDSFGTVYALAEEGNTTKLYRLSSEQFMSGLGAEFASVEGVDDKNVYAIATGLNHPAVYVALDAGDGKNVEIVKLGADGPVTTAIVYETAHFIDMASDADGGLYVLGSSANGFTLSRYQLDETAHSYVETASYPFAAKTNSSLTRIHVSAIHSPDVLGISYRDILVVDSGRHTMLMISAKTEFGIVVESDEIEPESLAVPQNPSDEVLRELVADCPVFARPCDVFPLMRKLTGGTTAVQVELKAGLRVVVEQLDLESDYTMILADNTEYAGGVIVGYVRNRYLSDAYEYVEPDEMDKTQIVSGERAFIYRYPLAYLPLSMAIERDKTSPPMEKLAFVFMIETLVETPDGDETRLEYGYTDNYGNEWYRVRYGELPNEVGYVFADTVDPPSAVPLAPINKNARIILDKNYPDQAFAPVFYKNEQGIMVEDNTLSEALPIGIKVEVMDLPFDSSRTYTLVRISHGGATYERYVRTANLSYEGVDIVKVMAICVILLTLVVMGLVSGRYFRLKKSQLPSDDSVNYV